MTPQTLLLVEDEAMVREPLAALLAREGYAVSVAASCAEARRAAAARPALVLLDWMLPDGQGVDLLREWRRAGWGAPVIFLTARTELIDRVLGLELGADDYVCKPFEPRELLARVAARLRRVDAAPSEGAPLVVGGLTLDVHTREVRLAGQPVPLAKLEFDLLRLLMENPRRVFTRDELLDRVWGYESYPTTRTVDTHIHELRKKLPAELFQSVRGVGYRFVPEGGQS